MLMRPIIQAMQAVFQLLLRPLIKLLPLFPAGIRCSLACCIVSSCCQDQLPLCCISHAHPLQCAVQQAIDSVQANRKLLRV
jgi:hypothetical protein